jgi:hydroxypyruvate isomerase
MREVLFVLRFSANLNFLFNEVPFMERFAAASKAGFSNVEFMFPYDYDIEELQKQLKDNDLQLVLCNLPAGNWEAGDRGIAVDPQRKEEFIVGVKKAIAVAQKLNVPRINCLVGKKPIGVSEDLIWETLVENMNYAAGEFAKIGIDLMIEPINHFDMPGFYLTSFEKTLKLISEVKHNNVYLQYDIYHAERENEDHDSIIQNYIKKIGHIQLADNPGRNQPGTGTIDYKKLLKKIDNLGFEGYIGMEYKPLPDTATSLKWVEEHGFKI